MNGQPKSKRCELLPMHMRLILLLMLLLLLLLLEELKESLSMAACPASSVNSSMEVDSD